MAVLTTDAATTRRDELALADDERMLTWAELDVEVNQLVNALRDAGISAGDTVAIICGNRVEWFEMALACAHTGATFVPVNWHLVGPELAYIIGDSGSKVVFADARYADEILRALDDPRASGVELALMTGGPATDRFEGLEDFRASGSTNEPDAQSYGGPMFYTSGTTGNPKGVRGSRSARPPGTSPAAWRDTAEGVFRMLRGPERTVLCGPAYHSAQWAFSFMPLVRGASMVMQHTYDSAGVLDLIDSHRATNIHLVPTQMKRLVDLPDDVKATFDGSSLRIALHGAAPCPPAVKRGLIDWWGPKLTEYYGSTEGSIITLVDSPEWLERGGSVGRPLPGIDVVVVGDDGQRLGTGEAGTLYFRHASGNDFEYHNAPEKTADAHLEPGLFTTGDVGYLDDDGALWLSDRKIDMIIAGGVNIYPAEIEGVLGGHPEVADVTVIGVPHAEYGEEVKAVVVPTDGVTADDGLTERLLAHCREQLAKYKCPRSIDFVDALPRTGTGKVQKRKVRAPYWEGVERTI